MTNEYFMQLALRQAELSRQQDEVPIGCVIVKDGKVIASAHNTRNATHNAVDHAEVVAIQQACQIVNDWRLTGCSLYVTLEPCVMCLGACYNARISNVYFGAYDVNGNGCVYLAESIGNTLNHDLQITGGIMEKECSAILTQYFNSKRQK